MSKSQTTSNKEKSKEPGIKSHDKFIQDFKLALIQKIKDKSSSDDLKLLETSILKSKGCVDIFQSLIYDLTIPADILSFCESHLIENIHQHYEVLWEPALLILQEQDWYELLESQEHRYINQRTQFRFYWRIFNQFILKYVSPENPPSLLTQNRILNNSDLFKDTLLGDVLILDPDRTNENEARDRIAMWLFKKSRSYRIKVRVSLTERELIEFIERKWFSLPFKYRPLIVIDSTERFVKTHFLCKDSRHDTKIYPHKINVSSASEFILFMRFLQDECAFFDFKLDGKTVSEKEQTIEIQLWLEYMFFDVDGFSPSSIETFLTRSVVHNTRKLTDFKRFHGYATRKKNKKIVTVKSRAHLP